MEKNQSAIMYYRGQMNKLAYYLLENVGISKARMGKILGVSRTAISIQFPTRMKEGD